MLLLGSKSMTIEGITVFLDHADPSQFWYLPGPVNLARKGADRRAAFTLIEYRPAAVAGGAKGGGFLSFEVNLHLDPALEGKILSKVSSMSKGVPKLAAVPFDEGKVQCIALNLQGSGGTNASPAGPGTFNAVETILGASVPSLFGDNSAAFSMTLSQEGAIIARKAFEEGTTPIGVIYDLKFTGIRPALDVKITADLQRIYTQFSASLSGQYYFIQAGIDAGFEKLVQEGAIKIEVTNFTTEGDRKEKEKWALDLFKDKLLSDWFTPTLAPGQLAGGTASSGTEPKPKGSDSTPAGKDEKPATGSSTPPKDSSKPSGSSSDTGSSGVGTKPPASSVRTAAAARKEAKLDIESNDPDPLPAGYSVTHTPSSSGTVETITVSGGNNPVVRVDGELRQLDSNHQFTVDVPHGSNKKIDVEYPASSDVFKTFQLFFDFEKPRETGWPASLSGYLTNNPNTNDDKFLNSTAPSGSSGLKGADALRDWIKNQLVSPAQVTIDSHASYEGKPEKRQYNQSLSERRLKVAEEIVDGLASISSSIPHGQDRAEAANRVRDENDRISEIKGKTVAGSPSVTVKANISRPNLPEQPSTPPEKPPEKPPVKPAEPSPPSVPEGKPAIALKIKFIRQEEQKTITLEYHSSEAVQRTYAPQGFFGLLLADLEDKEKYFVDVDLDAPFFRVFTVNIDAPIDFQKIGLNSVHVAIDYGNPSDMTSYKHGDFIFDAADHGEKKFEVFMNPEHDTFYTYQVQYNFDPGSGWEGKNYSYELPPKRTEDRTLNLNPFEDIGFLDVRVFPNRIDKGIVDSTDVHLLYQDRSGWTQERIINVIPGSEPQFWKLRLNDPRAKDYTYWFVHNMKDGSTKQTEHFITSARAVSVDDPFEGKIEIELIPLYDPSSVRMVYVDVVYSDPENQYEREERVKLMGNASDSVKVFISLMDPSKRTFKYRFTFIGSDNNMRRGPFIETLETLIGVSE